MRFSINKSELLNALTVVSKGASSRSTLPVLTGVFIQAQGSGLILQTTDLKRSIRYDVAALVDEPGVAVIPEKLLFEIVKNLPDAAVGFETHDTTVEVYCDNSSYTLKTLDASDFPPFPEVAAASQITIPFDDFCSMVKRTARVVSKDQSRAVLTGVLISVSDGVLRMVATDSYRLAVSETAFEGPVDDFEVIVAGGFLQEVASLPKLAESITLGVAQNQVVFNYQNMVLINPRIEGNFPAYQKLIPSSYTTRSCFTTADLIAGIRRAGLVSSPGSPVRFDINADAKNAVISSAAQDVGTAQETVPCEVDGENVEIGFNQQYILEGLQSVGSQEVFLDTLTSLKPGILRSASEESFLYLVMPVRIG